MKSHKSNLYMGLKGSSWTTKNQLFDISQNSIYYWWWHFLRLTPEFWYAKRSGHEIVEANLRKVDLAIGGHPSPSFKAWWTQYGVDAFAESPRDDQVRLVNPSQAVSNPDTVLVEVPLSLNKREIASQFNLIINKVHRGRKYDVEEYSNAQLKLYNHKYNLLSIERQYWVLLYKLIYPQVPLWVIGDRLRLAPHLDVRHLDRRTVERRQEMMFLQLQSHTWRYHAHAENLRSNLKRGSFPNYSKASPIQTSLSFGTEHDAEFKASTDESHKSESAWQLWLKRHYQPILHGKIKELNRFENVYKQNSHYHRNFLKFVQGNLEM